MQKGPGLVFCFPHAKQEWKAISNGQEPWLLYHAFVQCLVAIAALIVSWLQTFPKQAWKGARQSTSDSAVSSIQAGQLLLWCLWGGCPNVDMSTFNSLAGVADLHKSVDVLSSFLAWV